MGSEGHQDIDLAILTALLKGGLMNKCINACVSARDLSVYKAEIVSILLPERVRLVIFRPLVQ